MKKVLIVFIVLALAAPLGGCTKAIRNIKDAYNEAIPEVREFAEISAKDWLFGSGIIQAALDENLVPNWVFEELRKVDAWFMDAEGNPINATLNDFQLGYTVGVRVRLAGPIIKAAVEQYAPGILGIREVVMVLGFIGL